MSEERNGFIDMESKSHAGQGFTVANKGHTLSTKANFRYEDFDVSQ